MWNNFIENEFFDNLCGKDYTDYRNAKQYQQVSIQGEGYGTKIKY